MSFSEFIVFIILICLETYCQHEWTEINQQILYTF